MAKFHATIAYVLLPCLVYVHATQQEFTALAINKGVKYYPKIDDLHDHPEGECNPTSVVTRKFFPLVADSPLFVDKTLLIKEILATPNRTILITCPKKWGKSIALDMINNFLSIDVDDNGKTREPRTETRAYKLFKHGYINENKSLEKPLLISSHDDVFAKYQGQYPVISVDMFFYGFANLAMFHTLLQLKVSFAYKRHKYMLDVLGAVKNSTTSTAQEKDEAHKAYSKFMYYLCDDVASDDLVVGLKYLSELLHKHHKKKVYLLLDEYDNLINFLLIEYKSQDKDKVKQMYLKFVKNSVHDNPYVEKCIMTGITGIARSIPETGLSDVINNDIFSNPFGQYIGHTDREMRLISDHMNYTQKIRDSMEEWYDGYKVNVNSTLKMYCSQCVNTYMKLKEFDEYWEVKDPVLKYVLPRFMALEYFEEVFCLLVSGSYYPMQLDTFDFTNENWNYLEHVIAGGEPDNEYALKKGSNPITEALHFLLVQGYLTWRDYKYMAQAKRYYITVQIPNKDVAKCVKAISSAYYVDNLKILRLRLIKHTRKLNRLFENFVHNNSANTSDEFVNALQEFLHDLPRFTDDEYNRTSGVRSTSTQMPTTHGHINDPKSLAIIRSALMYVFSMSDSFRIHCTRHAEVWPIDIIMTHGNRGIILNINRLFNETFQILFKYNDYFKHIENVKMVGIGVKLDKSLFMVGYNIDIRKED